MYTTSFAAGTPGNPLTPPGGLRVPMYVTVLEPICKIYCQEYLAKAPKFAFMIDEIPCSWLLREQHLPSLMFKDRGRRSLLLSKYDEFAQIRNMHLASNHWYPGSFPIIIFRPLMFWVWISECPDVGYGTYCHRADSPKGF